MFKEIKHMFKEIKQRHVFDSSAAGGESVHE